VSQFFFAWVTPGTPWSSALERYDENIISFSIEHNEGDIPAMTAIIKNPKVGLLNPGRLYWAWLAWEDDTGHVWPLFYGRLVGVPTDTLGEAITLKFIARPSDYIRQKQRLAETLKVAPGYDRVFTPAGKLDDPDAILEGYSLMYHVDRLSGVVSVSDILIGEDGQINYGGGTATYASVKIHLNQPPLNAIAVQATVNWEQQYRGNFDVIFGQISTFTGEGFISDWPTSGKSLGGGYWADVGWAANADATLQLASALGNVSGSYSWQNLEKKHHTGDTMSVNTSYSHNAMDSSYGNGPAPGMGGIKAQIYKREQIGRQIPYTVDVNGDPAPVNLPYQLDITWMEVVPWNVAFDLTLGYQANRQRSEFLFFTLQADTQQVITDPLVTEVTEVLNIQSSNLSTPEITFLNWDSVSGGPVALGAVVFPDDPSVPGQTSSQICTTAGTAGLIEPLFSNIAGQTTADGSVVWTSFGATPPPDSAQDWNRFLNVSLGTLLLPLPVTPQRISSVLQPGLMTWPPHGVFINQYQLLADDWGTPPVNIFECNQGGLLGGTGVAPAPLFSEFTNPSGSVMYICTKAGQTGEYHTTFNETKGATTEDGLSGNAAQWTSLGTVSLPIGGWPGNTPARSYFPGDRGQQSVQHLICRARAKLRKRARAVQISWETPFLHVVGLSCRMNASISDSRIPGGMASGKVIAYKIIAQGNTGRLYGEVTIGCTVGNDGHVSPDSGTPEYVADGYVELGYQVYDGEVVTFADSDIGYTPPVEQTVDDGLVFPLTYEQAVLTDQFNGSQAEELNAVHEAIFLAEEAAYNHTSSTLTVTGGASVTITYDHPDYAAVANTMRNANLVGVGRWYQLSLKPLTNGPFSDAYQLVTTVMKLPKTIDLSAPPM
jgi:hypothetical protein